MLLALAFEFSHSFYFGAVQQILFRPFLWSFRSYYALFFLRKKEKQKNVTHFSHLCEIHPMLFHAGFLFKVSINSGAWEFWFDWCRSSCCHAVYWVQTGSMYYNLMLIWTDAFLLGCILLTEDVFLYWK